MKTALYVILNFIEDEVFERIDQDNDGELTVSDAMIVLARATLVATPRIESACRAYLASKGVPTKWEPK